MLRWIGDGSSLSVVQYTAGPTVLDLHRRLMFDRTLGPAIGPLGAASFDWTIDGRAAFGAGSNLFVLSPDGSRRQHTWKGGTDPAWSPDGRQIAFLRRARGPATTGGLYLWVLDRRGGPARRLGDEPVEPVGYGPSGFLASPPEWQPLPR